MENSILGDRRDGGSEFRKREKPWKRRERKKRKEPEEERPVAIDRKEIPTDQEVGCVELFGLETVGNTESRAGALDQQRKERRRWRKRTDQCTGSEERQERNWRFEEMRSRVEVLEEEKLNLEAELGSTREAAEKLEKYSRRREVRSRLYSLCKKVKHHLGRKRKSSQREEIPGKKVQKLEDKIDFRQIKSL